MVKKMRPLIWIKSPVKRGYELFKKSKVRTENVPKKITLSPRCG